MRMPITLINDREKIEEVYKRSEQYLTDHDNLESDIAAHIWACNEVQDLVPQTLDRFWSGHFFPFAESYYELESSFELCKQGFYRHSFFGLRSVLELGTMGLYFDKDDQAHIDIQKWLTSKDPTPHFRKSVARLFQLEYFAKFDSRFSLRKEIEELYNCLSDHVHVRGFHYSSSGHSGSNFNQFNESALRQYADLMKRVVKGLVTMMLLKYPVGMQDLPLWEKFGFNTPAGGFLDESSRPTVLAVLDKETKQFLRAVSDSDATVDNIVKGMVALPDLTEEQLQKQRAEWDATIGRCEHDAED